jgi:hypothetical protein
VIFSSARRSLALPPKLVLLGGPLRLREHGHSAAHKENFSTFSVCRGCRFGWSCLTSRRRRLRHRGMRALREWRSGSRRAWCMGE